MLVALLEGNGSISGLHPEAINRSCVLPLAMPGRPAISAHVPSGWYLEHVKGPSAFSTYPSAPRRQTHTFRLGPRLHARTPRSKTIDIPLKASTLAFWDVRRNRFTVEAEPVKLMIGSSSKTIVLTTRVTIQ